MVNIMIFASGTGSNFENIVNSEIKSPTGLINIKGLIVDKEKCKAREKANFLNIKEYFINPKSYLTKAEFEEKIVEILKAEEIELIVLAGYMRIIGETILKKYSGRIINIHPSLLPKFQGKDAIVKAFENKEIETGVTIHYVDSGVDTGEIIEQKKIEIDSNWNLEKLQEEIHKIEYEIYPKVIRDICKKLEGEKNLNEESSNKCIR